MLNNIGLLLAKRAMLNPDLEAVVDVATDRRLSYSQLNRRCNRIANALLELGVRRGDRVALLQMNSVEFVETFLAVAKIGAICVPLNWRLVADELAFILQDSGTSALVFGREFLETVAELQGRPALSGEGEGASNLRHYLQVDGETATWAHDYAGLSEGASFEEPEVSAGGSDDLYIMYTSGTTGLPKGVVHTHDTALWGSLTILVTAEMRHADRYMVALPLFHVGALTPLTANIHRGVTSILLRAFDPSQVWRLIESEKVQNMLAVPAMLNFMLQVPDRDQVDRSSLRWIMSGAAPVPVSLIRQYAEMQLDIHQVYGMTETCGPACLTTPETAVRKAGSTGKAFVHTEVRVVNESGTDVAVGEGGEVWIRGPHIMKEYWNRPEATAATLVDGWLRSGDVATVDEEGFIYIQDRKKDMFISGGENVYPAEVENVILAHAGVADVAVIGQSSTKWGESGFAIVVRSDAGLSELDVLEHCKGKLAGFKIPTGVAFIEEIPRNPSGKILKRLLREDFPGPAAE
ncbi:MAG: long-chain fatty acid--CoA ligase [Myxococcota bacterium]|nr:long-chain fatty acid--CoA ligase [Myxococcota bacterium]